MYCCGGYVSMRMLAMPYTPPPMFTLVMTCSPMYVCYACMHVRVCCVSCSRSPHASLAFVSPSVMSMPVLALS